MHILTHLISCITLCFLLSKLFKMMSYKKFAQPVYSIIYLIGCLSLTYINTFHIPLANLAFCIVFTLILGKFFYYSDRAYYYIYLLSFILILAVVEELAIIFVLFITSFFISNIDNYILIYTNVANIFIIYAYRIIITAFQEKNIRWVPKKWILVYACTAVFSIINIITIMSQVQENQKTYIYTLSMISVLFIAILNMFIVDFFMEISEYHYTKLKLATSQKNDEIRYEYILKVEKNYEQSRALLHDFKNHIQIIEQLYKNSKFADASLYQEQLYKEIHKSELKTYTQNLPLNIILNDKAETANKHQINTDIKIDNDLSFMTDYDITVIFGNLFDNAIEACLNLHKKIKQITLFIVTQEKLCLIIMSNPVDDIQKRNKFKKNHQGLGLKNIGAVLGNYNGTMAINTSDEKFEVSIQVNTD